MTEISDRRRRHTLLDLIALRVPLSEAIAAVRRLPWDSDADLVRLTRTHVTVLLMRYLAQELTAGDLEAWANAIEAREDIGAEELLRTFVFETANPALCEDVSNGFARRWIGRIDG
ncbi:MAG TPA: hypothetical protein VMB79_05055 [Jatrophihabitans sp.]|nr:hypothetical protein [Jatrophihabitans sp.]